MDRQQRAQVKRRSQGSFELMQDFKAMLSGYPYSRPNPRGREYPNMGYIPQIIIAIPNIAALNTLHLGTLDSYRAIYQTWRE